VKFATYNVNGIGARLPRLLEWLEAARPDVVGLQEIKTETDRFPFRAIEEAGFHALVHGQKGFNGVAILSRERAEEVQRGLADPMGNGPDGLEDMQSRWIEAEVGGVHFACLYLPNGNPVPGGPPRHDGRGRAGPAGIARAFPCTCSQRLDRFHSRAAAPCGMLHFLGLSGRRVAEELGPQDRSSDAVARSGGPDAGCGN